MNSRRQLVFVVLALLLLLGSVRPALAQRRQRYYLEPQWLRLKISQAEFGFYLEGDYDSSTFNDTSTVSHDRLFLGPLLGISLDGSVYHPNFCVIHVYSEGAYGETWENV